PDTATSHPYTLSLHDALPILTLAIALEVGADELAGGAFEDLHHLALGAEAGLIRLVRDADEDGVAGGGVLGLALGDEDFRADGADRKSTRLNSSHVAISYAVF